MQYYRLCVVGGNSVIVETQKTMVGRSLWRSVLVRMVGTSCCSGLMLLRRSWSVGARPEALCQGEEQVSQFRCYVFCCIATSLALKSPQQLVGGSSRVGRSCMTVHLWGSVLVLVCLGDHHARDFTLWLGTEGLSPAPSPEQATYLAHKWSISPADEADGREGVGGGAGRSSNSGPYQPALSG